MASIAAAAKHIFMSERNFKTLLDSGAMTRAPRGDYNLDKVRKERLRYLEAKKAADEGGGSSSLSEARTRVAVARAEASEFENEKTKGDWCRFEDACSLFFAELMVLRENLLSAPGKIADSLMQAANREDAYSIAYDEIWEAMGRMAKGKDAVTFAIEVVERAGGSNKLLREFMKAFEAAHEVDGHIREWGWEDYETGKARREKGNSHV